MSSSANKKLGKSTDFNRKHVDADQHRLKLNRTEFHYFSESLLNKAPDSTYHLNELLKGLNYDDSK